MNDNSHSQKKFFDNSIIKKLYKKFQSNIEFQMRAYSLPKLSKFGFFQNTLCTYKPISINIIHIPLWRDTFA